MEIVPAGFLVCSAAARGINIRPVDEEFACLWRTIVEAAQKRFDGTAHASLTMVIQGVTLEVRREDYILRYKKHQNVTVKDGYLAEYLLPQIKEIYYRHAPYTGKVKRKLVSKFVFNGEIQGDYETIEKAKLFAYMPWKTDEHVTLEEVAKIAGVELNTITNRFGSLIQGYEDYWIAKNFFDDCNLGAPPNDVLEGVMCPALIEGKFVHYKIRVPDDFGVMRRNEGDSVLKSFCIRRSKLVELVPDLLRKKQIRQITLPDEERIYTARVFGEKLIKGVGREILADMFKQAQEQYDALIKQGKRPTDVDWFSHTVLIDEVVMPISVFGYGKAYTNEVFGAKEIAVPYFKSIPEFQAKSPDTSPEWFNCSRGVKHFNGLLAGFDTFSRIGDRAYAKFDELYAEKIKWKTGLAHSFANNGPVPEMKCFDVKIDPEEVCIAVVSGGNPGAMAKFGTLIRCIDFFDLIAAHKGDKKKEGKKKAEEGRITGNYMHWKNVVAAEREKQLPENVILFSNMCLLYLSKEVKKDDAAGIYKHGSEDGVDVYLTKLGRQKMLDAVGKYVEGKKNIPEVKFKDFTAHKVGRKVA